MHNTFQRDLYRLRLEVARSYVKAVTASLTPITSSQDSSLKISAQVCGRKREEGGGSVRVLLIKLSVYLSPVQVQGLGPVFRLTITLQNTSSTSAIGHIVAFKCDESLHRIGKKLIQVSPCLFHY